MQRADCDWPRCLKLHNSCMNSHRCIRQTIKQAKGVSEMRLHCESYLDRIEGVVEGKVIVEAAVSPQKTASVADRGLLAFRSEKWSLLGRKRYHALASVSATSSTTSLLTRASWRNDVPGAQDEALLGTCSSLRGRCTISIQR